MNKRMIAYVLGLLLLCEAGLLLLPLCVCLIYSEPVIASFLVTIGILIVAGLILARFKPKDKTIFLMCGGGGYAGMTKSMLVALGWDEEKIYNTGGYWYYKGENNVTVKNNRNDEVTYDFWKIAYHDIDFKTLHEVK